MADEILTQEYLNSILEYREGELYWKIKSNGRLNAGDRAGRVNNNGYRQIQVKGKRYSEHRIVFLMLNGYLPEYVDHIDGNRTNNLQANLRASDAITNQHNAKTRKDNKLGIKGVRCVNGRWYGNIKLNGEQFYTKAFTCSEAAIEAIKRLRMLLHGEFANHG